MIALRNLYDIYGVNLDLTVYYIDNQDGTKYGNINPSEVDKNARVQQIEKGDKEFKNAIEEKLRSLGVEIDPELGITVGNISSIQELTLDGKENAISDISSISELTALKRLTLKNLNLANLNGLDNCLLIEYLYFDTCTISDISKGYKSLESLVKLNTLYMKLSNSMDEQTVNNQVLGLSNGLSKANLLTNLKTFGIFGDDTILNAIDSGRFAQISDFTGQDDGYPRVIGNIDIIGSKRSHLRDISCLNLFNTELKESIKFLYLFLNNLNSLNGLEEFTGFTDLWVYGNNDLVSLNGLENHINLINLFVFNSGLTDFNGLKGCSSLDYILCSNSNLNSLAGLENLNFSYIYCDDCLNLLDITALGKVEGNKSVHSKLNLVSFRNCQNLENVSPLGVVKSLKYLFLTGCKANDENKEYWLAIDEVVGLCGSKAMLPDICANWLSNSDTRDFAVASKDDSYEDNSSIIESLRNKTKVTRLTLKNNSKLSDDYLNGLLSTMTGLEYLQLFGCSGLSTCSFLSNMNNLKELDIRGTNIVDLTNLNTIIKSGKMINLRTLIIDNTSTDMTKIQDVINKLGSSPDGSDFKSWVEADYNCNRGFCLVGDGYDFSKCLSITQFKSSCNYDSGAIDLSNCINLKNFDSRGSSRSYILPSGLEYYFSRNKTGIDDLSKVLHLKKLSSDERVSNFNGLTSKFNKSGLIDEILLSRYTYNVIDFSFINNFSQITQKSIKIFSRLEGLASELNDVSGLEKLTGLQVLYIGKINLNNLSFIDNMNSLSDLTFTSVNVADWSSLKISSSLAKLTITDCNIGNLNFLKADNTTLTTLEIKSSSTFSNLEGIAHLKNIKNLVLTANSISKLSELMNLIVDGATTLENLTLDSNPIGNTSVYENDNIEVLRTLKSIGTEISYKNCDFSSELKL